MAYNEANTLLPVCRALKSEAAVAFVRAAVLAGYHENFPAHGAQVERLVNAAFDKLAFSQRRALDPQKLFDVSADLIERTFKKGDGSFWFNDLYHQYKTQTKPEADFQQLQSLIAVQRVLDYGCGSGYLAARLDRAGYRVFTTDVLDYRYPEARHLPFAPMASPNDIAYPKDSMDTALVQAVLHHIEPDSLLHVIRRLAEIARVVLIKEDTYDLPRQLPGLSERLSAQPLLQAFTGMARPVQFHALVLIDFYANAIAQGVPEMNMPFAFRTVREWQELLATNGLRLSRTIILGFEPGRMHKSCHVWFVCERAG